MNHLGYYVFRNTSEGSQYMDRFGRWVYSILYAELFADQHAALKLADDYRNEGAQVGIRETLGFVMDR